MSRRTELKPSIGVTPQADPFTFTSTLEFITPMFGGGVRLNAENPHLKEADSVTPVRGAAVRGALREWWRRVCCEGVPLAEMKRREERLWGWASTKGLVSIAVTSALTPRPVGYTGLDLDRKYGAFPLQPAQGGPNPGSLISFQGTFSVTISMDGGRAMTDSAALWVEIQRTWLAFVSFGGLGGRTRRGFGAIRVVDTGATGLDEAVASLGWKTRLVKRSARSAEDAHKQALGRLRSFRQFRTGPRGRSRWPEPDEIRKLTNRIPPAHAKPIVVVPKFPRAAFGMPIIFHFMGTGEPGDQSLQPRGKERLASPLILRPFVEPDGSAYAVCLRLPGRDRLAELLGDLTLGNTSVSGRLTAAEKSKIEPLRSTHPSADLDAVYQPFFDHFQK